jgi:hypothetical protein
MFAFDLIPDTRSVKFLTYSCVWAAWLPKNLVERHWQVLTPPTSG